MRKRPERRGPLRFSIMLALGRGASALVRPPVGPAPAILKLFGLEAVEKSAHSILARAHALVKPEPAIAIANIGLVFPCGNLIGALRFTNSINKARSITRSGSRATVNQLSQIGGDLSTVQREPLMELALGGLSSQPRYDFALSCASLVLLDLGPKFVNHGCPLP